MRRPSNRQRVRSGSGRFQEGERFKRAGDEGSLAFVDRFPEDFAQPASADDGTLREMIVLNFEHLPDDQGREVEVTVQGGAVTLSGRVADRYIKYLAEEIVLAMPGTRKVHNRLEAADPLSTKHGDPDAKHHEVLSLRERLRSPAGPPRVS